ncbi:hypothetical protein Lsai_2718 [Legionella sainthelensi]|uniref:Uncharacterized protein n=1 Tax=Legionella sainthelensi TaxID=28087 RepID=A0A0W0YEV6_9GAMM|nr:MULTISPECIES: hypothetical protein [Legionella]KTD55126.1 hypothetical protein Lsai_2718 [Legionella sainthelensi]MCZ4683612.1 zinc ribbon domain-containing protein [Legionella pneumophila]MDW9134209.1 zinc ribbon domain-containing protein [Legionella pneumophila]VEH36728.1 Uncharacterised protein [Legionella sainthelensi]HAU1161715.1 zinc ribbon domain-containing protein [Legionella pneumophila]
MSFLKRLLGVLGIDYGGYRNSHQGQTSQQSNYLINPELRGLSCPCCRASLAYGVRFYGQCGDSL